MAWFRYPDGIIPGDHPRYVKGRSDDMDSDVYYGDFPHISGIFHSGDNRTSDRQFDRGLSGAVRISEMQKQEAAAAVWLFLIAVLALTGIWIGKDTSMILTIVLFAMTTASMMGVNTIFVNFFPLRYEAIGKVSTVSGFMNGMAYVGTAVSTFTIGVLVEQKGWDVTIGSWVVMTFLALMVCMLGKKKIFVADGII